MRLACASALLLSFGILAPPAFAQCELQELLAGDGAAGDAFGAAVAISGSTAVIGATDDDDLGSSSGAAYVFELRGASWVQTAKLLASDGSATDSFGSSVAISGNTVVIGVELDDDLGIDSGSAYVFELQGTSWVQTAKLLASDGAADDLFGSSVAVSGDTAFVGARWDNDLGTNSGAVYVYELQGVSWVETAKLLAAGGGAREAFGTSVALSGDVAVIGADHTDDLGVDSGSAFVFELQGTSWVQTAQLLASDGATLDHFGVSVALSGDTVLIGAYRAQDLGFAAGSAYVFELAGTSWVQTAKLLASDGATGDWFGYSVAISGSTAVVGGSRHDDLGAGSGAAYVFEPQGTSWVETAKLLAGDGDAGDGLGLSVDISGEAAVIGAAFGGDSGVDQGSAYVFELCPSGAAVESVRLGVPANPSALLPGATSGPVIGSTWDPAIDHTTFEPGAVVDVLGVTVAATNLSLPPAGTLLCDTSQILLLTTSAPGVPFAVPVPCDCSIVGATLCSQGASVDAALSLSLTNALDITIGTF